MEATVQKKATLVSKMGRPKTAPLASFDKLVVFKILDLRHHHPGWGALTIWTELNQDKSLSGFKIPKPSTIALLLKLKGLTKVYEEHVEMPRSKMHFPNRPHHIWQIDSQGATDVNSIGRVNLINTKDVFSKLYSGTLPAPARSHNGSPSGTDYQLALRLAFSEFGMPQKIQTDHAGVFFENKGKSPFPTRFHLWLVSLGIDLIYSRKYRPTDQAVVERAHRTIADQVLKGQSFDSLKALHRYCDARRKCLNEQIPSSSTKGLPPLMAFPNAKFSGRAYRPEIERKLIQLPRIFQFLSQGKWNRKAGKTKTVHLGGQWYYIKKAASFSKVRITFEKKENLLIFRDVNELILDKQPIKGITTEILMGETFFEASLPDFQLQLPFTWEQQVLSMTFLDRH